MPIFVYTSMTFGGSSTCSSISASVPPGIRLVCREASCCAIFSRILSAREVVGVGSMEDDGRNLSKRASSSGFIIYW